MRVMFRALPLLCLLLVSCRIREPLDAVKPAPFLVFVSNEASGDIGIIDGEKDELVATLPIGKRPRGLKLSADGKLLFVAVSGSPRGGPGIDESKLPPPDRS